MTRTAQAEPAPTPMGQWMARWAEQQRQWAEALKSSSAADGPFAAMVAAMAGAMKTLPIDPLGPQTGSALPSMAEALLGRMDGAPTLAPLWDFDRKSVAASAAWWRLHEAQIKYRALIDSVWPRVQKTAAERQSEAARQPKAATARDGVEHWLDALNHALLDLMRTPAYLKAQRETLDAGLAFREAMGAIATDLCEWLQLPARDDVDDLARGLTELRREVRALQRPNPADARVATPDPQSTPRTRPGTRTRRESAGRAGR